MRAHDQAEEGREGVKTTSGAPTNSSSSSRSRERMRRGGSELTLKADDGHNKEETM